MRRALVSLALAGTLLTAAAPAVFGHECYIVNRSAAGNAGALNSSRWMHLSLADIFGFIHQFAPPPNTALSPAQITWAVGEAIREGVPADGWVVRSDKTIGDGSANPNLANGKGVDHLADVYGEQIVGIYFVALSH